MGQSSGSVGPAIGGSPFGGLRVLSPMDIARASPQYDPYTASRRPNYMPYGPNQQFYQPIYQPSYSQFSPMGYGQAPFGGFYQSPMMGFGQKFGQPQRSLNDLGNFDMTGQGVFRNNPMDRHMMPPEMFGPATDISDQGQAALRQMPQPMLSPQPTQTQYNPIPMQQTQPRGSAFKRLFRGAGEALSGFGQQPSNYPYSVNYGEPMLSPQPMQSQYRPIPFASQTTIDQVVSKARSEGAADAAAAQAAANASYGAAGGKVHEEGIDSLLRK